MRTRVILVILILAVLAACGGEGADQAADRDAKNGKSGMDHGMDEEGKSAGACEPQGASLAISANDVKFDKECLAAPAGQAFTIEFNNQEAIPHSVEIKKEHGSAESLFSGETFNGPGMRSYQVPALDAGQYHFHCAVHPEQMQGDFVVA